MKKLLFIIAILTTVLFTSCEPKLGFDLAETSNEEVSGKVLTNVALATPDTITVVKYDGYLYVVESDKCTVTILEKYIPDPESSDYLFIHFGWLIFLTLGLFISIVIHILIY